MITGDILTFSNVIMVALGGATGAVCRYFLGLIPISEKISFPVITLIINFVGAFAIGLIAFGSAKYSPSNGLTLFLKVGLCGGFTTFSTFSLEAFNLMENGSFGIAAIYICSSIVLCIGAVFLSKVIIGTFL